MPSTAAPVQPVYNIYRGATPGLASYYKDPARATKVANATAPYLDTDVTRSTTYYYVVTAANPSFPDAEGPPSGEIAVTTSHAGGKGGGGRPDMAQAGGPDGTKAQAALDAIAKRLGELAPA